MDIESIKFVIHDPSGTPDHEVKTGHRFHEFGFQERVLKLQFTTIVITRTQYTFQLDFSSKTNVANCNGLRKYFQLRSDFRGYQSFFGVLIIIKGQSRLICKH